MKLARRAGVRVRYRKLLFLLGFSEVGGLASR